MPADRRLLARSGDLKTQLVKFVQSPRFARELRRRSVHFGEAGAVTQADAINFTDWFILQHRLPDGRTVVDHFVAEHPELSPADRELLLGWKDVVEGVFEYRQLEGEALIAFNLIDELTYRVRSNLGPGVFKRLPLGSFMIARLVPVADEWMVSGSPLTLPPANRSDAYRLAADMARQQPARVFRNPEKLRRAWETEREERDRFIEFFGSDLIILPGRELPERMRAFHHYQMFELRDAEGRSTADRARELYGVTPEVPEMPLPEDLLEAESVGMIFDEVDGLNFLRDFALVNEAFAYPELVVNPRHRDVVLGYLKSPSISPRVFQRLANRDPERASRVFQQVLHRKRFSWERDGETLLRKHKAEYYARPVQPGVTPINEAMMRAELEAPRDRRSLPPRGRGRALFRRR